MSDYGGAIDLVLTPTWRAFFEEILGRTGYMLVRIPNGERDGKRVIDADGQLPCFTITPAGSWSRDPASPGHIPPG